MKWFFKFTSWPSVPHFLFVFLMEILHTIGLAMLCFMVMPHLDSVNALLITSSLAVLPSILLLISRFQETNKRELLLFWRGIEDEEIKDEREEDDNGKHKKKERSVFI